MPWPYIASAVISAGASYLSSERARRERQRRIDRLRQFVEQRRRQQLEELEGTRRRGLEDIGTYTEGLRSNEASRAERLARSLGRAEEAESYRLPQTQAVSAAGTQAIQRFLGDVDRSRQDIGRHWDAQALGIESDVAGEPIPPNWLDYIGLLAEKAPGIYEAATRQNPSTKDLAWQFIPTTLPVIRRPSNIPPLEVEPPINVLRRRGMTGLRG